jgi:hypothetical protein
VIHDIEGTNITTGDTDWRAADPPICPECKTDHGYWPWEMRDQYRATMRENAALRERVADLERLLAQGAAAERERLAGLVRASHRKYLLVTPDNLATWILAQGDTDAD